MSGIYGTLEIMIRIFLIASRYFKQECRHFVLSNTEFFEQVEVIEKVHADFDKIYIAIVENIESPAIDFIKLDVRMSL